ncbi:hypothetical protein [Pseudooceanicola sp.]|uniref:hypothetical protein n=1 Tax=Pseudooceanicola sp. TaxID=1914328 RepID=UPI0040597C23
MLKTATAAIALTLASAVPALSLDRPFPVSGVQVATDLDGVSVSDVTNFYPEFNADLEKAIWASVDNPKTDGGRGFQIDVKVTSIELDDAGMGPGGEFNELNGIVTYTFDGSDQPSLTTPIEVKATSGAAPAGVLVIPPSEADFYQAMVMGFANGVNDRMADLPEPTADAIQEDR